MVNVLTTHPDVSLVTGLPVGRRWEWKKTAPIPATKDLHYDAIIDGIRATNIFHGFGYNAIGEPTTTMFRREQALEILLRRHHSRCGKRVRNRRCEPLGCFARTRKLFYFCNPLSLFRRTDEQGSADNSLQLMAYKMVSTNQFRSLLEPLDLWKSFVWSPKSFPKAKRTSIFPSHCLALSCNILIYPRLLNPDETKEAHSNALRRAPTPKITSPVLLFKHRSLFTEATRVNDGPTFL